MTAEEMTNVVDKEKEVEGLHLLLEPSYLLLKDFKEMAPGTFKHSQTLVSMIEGVSEALDLDVVFMKVCALYHDIGKSVNAEFFSENQLDDENPHDKLDPWISAQLITRHVSDSVNILLNDNKFPREIIEVISQHHGNDVLKLFYDESKGKSPEEFRYSCTKPQSVEAAVLMIVDHVEAMSRAHMQAGKLNPKNVIENTINGLLDSGQLDYVVIRLGYLKKIKEALARELQGTFQKRVDYNEEEATITNNKEDK